MSSSRLKHVIFDIALFTYTVALLSGFIWWTAAKFGYPVHPPDQEKFEALISHHGFALFVLPSAAILILRLHRFARWSTVGDMLFAHPKSTRAALVHLLVSAALTLILSVVVTEASLAELLDQDGLAGAIRLWDGLTHPNFSLFARAVVQAIETIFIAFLATALAIPLAFILAFFCAKNLMTGPVPLAVYSVLRLFLNVSRSVEPLIWALIFTVWVGVGPFAGMLALMIHSVASLTKYYSEIIEAVSDQPIDGVRSTGANAIQVVWYAIVPQILVPYVGMTIYRWDTNVRMATVIGLVGGGGIGTLLIQYQGQAMWPEVGCIILVIAFIVWLMDTASAYIREALK